MYAGDEFYDGDATSGLLDHFARVARFAMTRDEAHARKCCVRCGDEIDDDWSTIDLAEWNISALCGACFDVIAEPAS